MRQSIDIRVVRDERKVTMVDVRVFAHSFAEAERLLADAIRQVREAEAKALEADAES